MRRLLPDGDPELGRVLVEGFEPAVAKARDAGVPVTERWTEHLGFGVAYRTDIHALHAHWASKIDDLRLNTPVKRAARSTATASPASSRAARRSKRAPCCWPAEVSKVTRSSSSASSAGTPTGSSCARTPAASATASGSRSPRARRPARGLGTFYGHTVASPLSAFEPAELPAAGPVPLEVVHPRQPAGPPLHGRGARRRGGQPADAAPAGRARRAAVRRRVRRERVVSAPYPHGQVIDRFEHARALGARITRRRQRRGAGRAAWGSGASTPRRSSDTLDAYEHGGPQDAPITAPNPLREPPFWAVEFQPTITFSLGGVRVDSRGRVLDRDGAAIDGLYARRRRRRRPAGPALRRGADARDGLRPAGRRGSQGGDTWTLTS